LHSSPRKQWQHFQTQPQFISAFSKFHGVESENAYFVIRELEKVCLMMRILQLKDDDVRLHIVPFFLKDLTKKWIYNLAVDSITLWNDFVKIILKKFYPIHETTLIKKNISSSKNLVNLFEGTLNVSKTSLLNVLIMATMPNSLQRFRLLNQDLLRNHVPRKILAKG